MIGAYKTWHSRYHVGAKGGRSKGLNYTCTYPPRVNLNKSAEIEGKNTDENGTSR